mgnify:CR=1 FL=1
MPTLVSMKAPDAQFPPAVRLLLADLARTVPALSVTVDPNGTGREVTAWVWGPSGGGIGVLVPWEGFTATEALAHLVDQLHDFVLEELAGQGLSTSWPPCPEHPDRHPLVAAAVSDRVMWTCPVARRPVTPVGSLGT